MLELEGIIQESHSKQIERCIVLFQRALKLVDREQNPQLWGTLNVILADKLLQASLDTRVDNLERAIGHYKQALQVFTQTAFPEDWANTHINLGNTFSN